MVACEGVNSDTRKIVRADFTGHSLQDRVLFADIVMTANLSTGRWFWCDPRFPRNKSALRPKQADDVWRQDIQLGRDTNPEEENKPENVIPRVKSLLRDDVEFEHEGATVSQFVCRRLGKLRHRNESIAGDTAHQVSPFGACDASAAVQDIDNLPWRLKLMRDGKAPVTLIDTSHGETACAADHTQKWSTRSTDFITLKIPAKHRFRAAVLELAEVVDLAKPLVHLARLSAHGLAKTAV